MNSIKDTKPKAKKSQGRSRALNPPRILIAEDDKEMRSLLLLTFQNAGYEVSESPDGFNLLNHFGSFLLTDAEDHERFDLIISDIRMPGVTGLEVLEGMHEIKGFPPMILITAFGDDQVHHDAEKYGAAALFDKPFQLEDLMTKVKELVPINGPSPPR